MASVAGLECRVAVETAAGAAVEDRGLRKAAIFIISLDEETASLVLSKLGERDAGRIAREIARLGEVRREAIAEVLEEFLDLGKVQDFVRQGGIEHAKALIAKSFPAPKAARLVGLLERREAGKGRTPFEFLEDAEPGNIHAFLIEEHPQTIALVLSHCEPSKAADVLGRFPPEKRGDIVKRIARIERSSPEAIRQVESCLKVHLSAPAFEEYAEIGGARTVAEILNVTDRAAERAILEDLRGESPELVETIVKMMFVFEDIVRADDRGVQNLLKEIDNRQLALALKTASKELKEKIFVNMSARAAETVREEIGYLGPVRVCEVERAQAEIVDVVRRLEESGSLFIAGRGGEGDLVV